MSKWVEESIDDGLRLCYQFRKELAHSKSKYQDIELLDTVPFGKVLLLDGLCQSTEIDEHVYHETLVHPALLSHPNPKTVFIAGGGEGSTAREILRHKSVEKVVMIDIDKDVVDFCRTHWHTNHGAFNDSRLQLIIDDAKAGLEKLDIKFDVMVIDVPDPQDGGPCYHLFCQDFYEFCRTKLNPGGILISQCGPAGAVTHKQVFSPVYKTLSTVFPHVASYIVHVWSFCDCWGFNMAFENAETYARFTELCNDPAKLDHEIATRIGADVLRHYDGICHRGMFSLPKEHRQSLASETHVYTVDNPAFISGGTSGLPKAE